MISLLLLPRQRLLLERTSQILTSGILPLTALASWQTMFDSRPISPQSLRTSLMRIETFSGPALTAGR